MPQNPPPGHTRITPYLNYEDVGAMLTWLADAFGMVETHQLCHPDGTVRHAQMTLDDGVVMMGAPGGDFKNPKNLGQSTSLLYIYVEDCEAMFARACAAGAGVFEEPCDTPYGDRRCGVVDPEGHRWCFATHVADD